MSILRCVNHPFAQIQPLRPTRALSVGQLFRPLAIGQVGALVAIAATLGTVTTATTAAAQVQVVLDGGVYIGIGRNATHPYRVIHPPVVPGGGVIITPQGTTLYHTGYPVYSNVVRVRQRVVSPTIRNSTLVTPTLINPTVVNSTLINPTLVNPTLINSTVYPSGVVQPGYPSTAYPVSPYPLSPYPTYPPSAGYTIYPSYQTYP